MGTERTARAVAWGLFLLSGLTGLVYEVLWTRALSLVFGNTVYAASTVLAAYMGGLALGAWLLGRVADRSRRPLLLYGILEAVVGLSALLFPLALQVGLPVLQSLYRGGDHGTLGVLRFALAFGYLLIPTAAMGGTLPALARLMTDSRGCGRTLSWLYGLNTFGAVLGTLAAGFWLLPRFGLGGTQNLTVALNLAIAVAAAALGWKVMREPSGPEAAPSPEVAQEGPEGGHFATPIVLGAYLLSGALALALEVLWTRSLLLVFGSTVYSFATMLALFLLGLAAGSFLMGLWVERFPRPLLALGLVEAGVGLVTLVSIARFNRLPTTFLDGLISHGLEWSTYLATKVLIAAGILLPVALLFGATFPLVARLQVRTGARVGTAVGHLYAANTLGAIAGSLLGGFVLLPALGLQRGLAITALVALGLGALLLTVRRAGDAMWPRLACAGLLVAIGLGLWTATPKWDEKLLSAGVYFRPRAYISTDNRNILDQVLGEIRLVRYIEGITETAAVVETPISRMFLVDGKVEASTLLVDMRLQRLQGHLPLLFARGQDRAVNIGLGCGITLGALKMHPLKELHCIELEENILQTARYFSEANHSVLDDPRLTVVLNDGRNHLLLTDVQYDVITSDPFEPLVGGAANLYTKEHFENGRRRLAPGGVFAQYLPMYQLSPEDFRMIIRSFCAVYPNVSLWYTGIDTIMLGSVEPHRLDLPTLEARMAHPGVRESLAEVGIASPEQLLQTFVMDPHRLPGLMEGPLNTDETPFIEFSAPRSHLVNTTPMNLSWLLENYHPEEAPLALSEDRARQLSERARAVGELNMRANLARQEGRYDAALEAGRKARELDPQNRDVLHGLSATCLLVVEQLRLRGERPELAAALLAEADSTGTQPLETSMALADLAFRSGRPDLALEELDRALRLAPLHPDLHLKRAMALQALGQPAPALVACDRARKLNPAMPSARWVRAAILADSGDRAAAREAYEQLLRESPGEANAQDWFTAGILRAEAGQLPEALAALRRAADLGPEDPRTWYNLARLQRITGDGGGSATSLDRARALAPEAVSQWLTADPVFGGTPPEEAPSTP